MTNKVEYISRGEVARRLGISGRTASRDMVRGRLWFRRDPVTGKVGIRTDSPRLLNPDHRVGCLCEPCNRPNPEAS